VLAAQSAGRGDGFLQLNRLLANGPDKAGSLRLVQRLAEQYPELAQAHYAIAQAAAGADQNDLALKEVREAARLAPDWELAALYEAALLQKTSMTAAADRLAGYLKAHPGSREVRLAYARVLVAGKSYPEARAQFEQLLREYPDNAEVVFSVAILSMQLEDWRSAETNLKRLLDLGYRDRDAVRFYLGQVAEEQKHWADALQWYAEVTRGEQFLPAQIRRAQVLSKQGDLDGARKFLQDVNAANNDQRAQLIIAEAQLLREANQPQAAFELVERGLDKLTDQPDLLYDYAMLADKVGRADLLESSLRKLIKLRPDNAQAYNALGYSFADRNERLDEAKELIETALKLAPEDSFIIDSLGWVLYRQGKTEEALKHLQRAYAGRQDPEIAAHLGEVLWVLGRRADAQKVWDAALSKTPSNDVLMRTVQRLKD
jgi:Flp pilus assembly protein TadD